MQDKNNRQDKGLTTKIYNIYVILPCTYFMWCSFEGFHQDPNQKDLILCILREIIKLEDLKVLRRSPDLLNNVKIGQGQLQLIREQILFYHVWPIMGVAAILVKRPKQSNEYSIKQPSDF